MTKPLWCGQKSQVIDQRLRVWYATRVGQRVIEELKPHLEAMLPELFGFYAVQVGQLTETEDLLATSRIRHRGCLDRTAGLGCMQGDPAALPIATDSLDLLFLVHSLDFAAEPHQVLREAERSLVPEGHLLLLGFNPISLFGLWRLALFWQNRPPWCARFYSVMRIQDWLNLLGLDVVDTRYVMFRPPWHKAWSWLRTGTPSSCRRSWRFWGGVYLVLARKRVATLTPVRPRWSARRCLVPGKLAEPTVRIEEHDN